MASLRCAKSSRLALVLAIASACCTSIATAEELEELVPTIALTPLNNSSNGSSVYCNDNSTACKMQKKEIANAKEQRREEVRSPDPGTPIIPKGSNGTIKSRAATIPMDINYTWAMANRVAFNKAVIADISEKVPKLTGRVTVRKFTSVGVDVIVVGNEASGLLDSVSEMVSNGTIDFVRVGNATGVKVTGIHNKSVSVAKPTEVFTPEVQKAVDLRALRKVPKLVLPGTDGANTTMDTILTRAAMRDLHDPSRNIEDGKTKRERRVDFVVDEIMQLIGAGMKKATKFDSKNTQAVNELLLQTHSQQALEAKKFMSSLSVLFDAAAAPVDAKDL